MHIELPLWLVYAGYVLLGSLIVVIVLMVIVFLIGRQFFND
jgi:hypothetical protein